MFVCPSVYMYVGLSVRPSICLSTRMSVFRPPVSPPVRLSVCLCVCVSVYVSVYLSVCQSVCLPVNVGASSKKNHGSDGMADINTHDVEMSKWQNNVVTLTSNSLDMTSQHLKIWLAIRVWTVRFEAINYSKEITSLHLNRNNN